MCNPVAMLPYIMAAAKWQAQEKALKAAREQTEMFAQYKASAATQRAGEKALQISVRQSNDVRKIASVAGKELTLMAGRGVFMGTGYTAAMQSYAMRSAELEGAFKVRQKQLKLQYGTEMSGVTLERNQKLKEYASTGMAGLAMELGTAMVTQYLATGSLGIPTSGPDIASTASVTVADATIPTLPAFAGFGAPATGASAGYPIQLF